MVLRVSGAQGLGFGLEVVDLSFGLGCWGLWTETESLKLGYLNCIEYPGS